MRDFYDVLGLSRGASTDDIRRAYRRLAREHHPDRNPGDARSEERFKEVTRAYEILCDPERRKVYDELGAEAEAIDFDPEKARTYRQWAEQGARGGGKGGFGAGPDLGDMFGDLFGGGGGFGGGARRGADVRTRIRVTFRDAVLGATRRIRLERPGPMQACMRCGGSGRLQTQRGGLQLGIPCPACGAEGYLPGASESAEIDLRIPPGFEDGQTLRLRGQGAPGAPGSPRGDLLVVVGVDPHPHLRREGLDLHLDLALTVKEALFGASVEVPTTTGKVRVRVPAGVRVGQKLRLEGKGVKAAAGTGHLFLHLVPTVPAGADPDDEALQAAVERLEQLYSGPVREPWEF